MDGNMFSNASLGSTARWTAGARAMESKREDHLFVDPWAEALAGIEGMAWFANRPPESTLPIVLRTRFFDDFLSTVISERATHQVVLVAAGLDTRAFRLNFPGDTLVFELDQPGVLAYKEQVLKSCGATPTCRRVTVPVDLSASWDTQFITAGYDPSSPALWLLEGLLFYIPSESITRILQEVMSLSASGSSLGYDVINSSMLTSPYTRQWVEMQAKAGAPWIGTQDDPIGFLAEFGWKAKLTQAGAPDANYGRWFHPVLDPHLSNFPHNWFVTADKPD